MATKLVTTVYRLGFPALPAAFDGFTVAHVSDLHNHGFGDALIERTDAAAPDIIVVTGDSINEENETEHTLDFFRRAAAIAPIYFVTGNHESVLDCYPSFLKEIQRFGVVSLHNESIRIAKGRDFISLSGIEDPTFFPIAAGHAENMSEKDLRYKSDHVTKAERRPAGIGRKQSFFNMLKEMGERTENEPFRLLLSHRPEVKDAYFSAGFDLTFTGHAHGGQFNLPLLGPLYAPNQGYFPKLTGGVHEHGHKKMIISRGLGDSHRAKRFRNPFELVVCSLTRPRPE